MLSPIFLSHFSESDLPDVLRFHQNTSEAELRQAKGNPTSSSQVADWLSKWHKQQGKTGIILAIRHIKNFQIVGYVTLNFLEHERNTAEIGIAIMHGRRKGFGTSAYSKIEKLAHEEMNINTIEARVANSNEPAQRFFLSNKFELISINQQESTFRKTLD